MAKSKGQQQHTNADAKCPYCKGETKHSKSQRPACKSGLLPKAKKQP
jgi:hypothetical protein